MPSAARLGLPVAHFGEITRWYEGLAALPAWRDAVAAKDAATAAWLAANDDKAGAVELSPVPADRP